MCNRFALPNPEEIAEHFAVEIPEGLGARFNIAPGEPIVSVVRAPGGRRLVRRTWGLRPGGLRSPGRPLANVRAERLPARPRQLAGLERCLVPAGGFFEWRRLGRSRLPHYFRPNVGSLLALGALADPAEDPRGRCAILTTAPNSVVAGVHDRMPVILPPDAYDAWLDPGLTAAALGEMLEPYPSDRLLAHPVLPLVNRVGVEDPQVIQPVPPLTLF